MANESPDATTFVFVSAAGVPLASCICIVPLATEKTVGTPVPDTNQSAVVLAPGAGVLSVAALRTVCVSSCIACIPCPSTSAIATLLDRVCSMFVKKNEIANSSKLAIETYKTVSISVKPGAFFVI